MAAEETRILDLQRPMCSEPAGLIVWGRISSVPSATGTGPKGACWRC